MNVESASQRSLATKERLLLRGEQDNSEFTGSLSVLENPAA